MPIGELADHDEPVDASTRPAFVASETQRSWVGLTIAFGGPGERAVVPNCRKPAAVNGLPEPAKSKTFSRPA